jgi:hypothetical protein
MTWPQQLRQRVNLPVITIAMDGASNQWIARQIKLINSEIAPLHIIAMWSYFHRREHLDTTIGDLQRRIHGDPDLVIQDFELFEKLVLEVLSDNLVNAVIPDCHDVFNLCKIWNNIRGISWPIEIPRDICELSTDIQDEISNVHKLYAKLKLLIEFNQRLISLKNQTTFVDYNCIDLARDSHHFGPATCTLFCDRLLQVIGSKQLTSLT